MRRASAWIRFGCIIVLGLGVVAAVQGFIETKLPLQQLIKDSDHIFLAKVDKVDPAKPLAVLTITKDCKGNAPYRRLPINLTGDKEKHTPQLLKRLAAEMPVVVFVTKPPDQHQLMGLAYANGTWFQILNAKEAADVPWSFTHCEIYLRRTFKGTTAEMQQAVEDVLANKGKPPAYNAKEPPGFGPEIGMPPPAADKSMMLAPYDDGPAIGVIVLPFAMPIAALLQLLFPGILRQQWRQYKIAVYVLLSQSTLIFAHWATCRWFVSDPTAHWWLKESSLWFGEVLVALAGAMVATARRWRSPDLAAGTTPARAEYVALGILALTAIGWGAYEFWSEIPPLRDEMGVVLVAALLAFGHLFYRRFRFAQPARKALATTELVFVWTLVLGGTAMGWYLHRPTDEVDRFSGPVRGQWLEFRGNAQRTGSLQPADAGPTQPRILWTFSPNENRGRVLIHSSPTVVDDQVYVGAWYMLQVMNRGYIYCINTADGRLVQDHPLKPGERLWRFTAGDTLKPVFSSPAIAAGKIYIGEGYHQDQRCRLLCLDARTSEVAWAKRTASHVESSPCVIGERIYFGAGDDGIFCVDQSVLEPTADGPPSPKTVWQARGLHVDSAPLVVGDRLFAGSVVGDVETTLAAVAIDVQSGKEIWRTPAPMPVPGSPAYANGRVFFGLGNGKMTEDADKPDGAIWCLDAATGQRLWEYPVGHSVLATVALDQENVYFGARDGFCYCLRQKDGSRVWKKDLKYPLAASAVVSGGKVYAMTLSGIVYGLDATDGRELWRIEDLTNQADEQACSSPTLVNGKLYVAVGGQVACIGDP